MALIFHQVWMIDRLIHWIFILGIVVGWLFIGYMVQMYATRVIAGVAFGFQYQPRLMLFVLFICITFWFMGPYILPIIFWVCERLGIKGFH